MIISASYALCPGHYSATFGISTRHQVTPIYYLGQKKPDRFKVRNGRSGLWLVSLLQTSDLIGGPQQSGNNPAATEVTLSFKRASIQ